MKNPPKYFKQTQTHCGVKLKWANCCRPGPDGCPDCLGAGGYWEECPKCGYQPYGDELLKDAKSDELIIELVKGVEGNCLVLNNYRIAGPKPWGGGQIIKSWKVSKEDIKRALKG